MKRALRPFSNTLLLATLIACSGDRAPGKDTASPEVPPPEGPAPTPPASTWNRAAGSLFAVRVANGANAWLINPQYGAGQALDTRTSGYWNVEGASLTRIVGATGTGCGRVSGV